MARILCINPWIYDFAAYNQWIEPLGLLSVAGVLRAAGHQVSLLDCLDRYHPAAPAPASRSDAFGCGHFQKTVLPKPTILAGVPRRWGRYGLPVEVFEAELAAQLRPAAVLVTSTMTYWYPGPFEVIRRVKARWPDVPVALGGIYATLCAPHARAHSGADAVFGGPSELQALEWVNAVTGDARSLPIRIEDVLPAHDLRRPQGYVAIRTARGCPYACPYCAVHQLSPSGFAWRDTQRVLAEIAWCAESLRTTDVAFYDDALLVDAPSHLEGLLDDVMRRGLRVRFHTPNGLHARFIDECLALRLRAAGFVTIRLGLESSDSEGQLRDGGKVDDASFARAARALWAAGYTAHEVAAYVLIGRPGQDVEQARATVAFAHGLGVPVSAAEYSPIPGTQEWRAAVGAGLIAPDVDPLLHNRAAYPCGNAEAWERLKLDIRAGNRTLLGAPLPARA